MSGAFGWAHHSPTQQASDLTPGATYRAAQNAHRGGGATGTRTQQCASPPSHNTRRLDTTQAHTRTRGALHNVPQKTSAANVVVVILDATGSMQSWPQEVYRRLPLFYTEATTYLGTDDLEMLFVVHGDARTDRSPVQVGKLGRGPELDAVLASFELDGCYGGGQGTESHELIARYLVSGLDTQSAQNVYAFFITDEAACDTVDERYLRQHFGDTLGSATDSTRKLFAALRRKMHVFTVLCETHSYDPAPIEAWWLGTLDREHVLNLDDARRVVDVMLGTMASLVGKQEQFEQTLRMRLLPTPHGTQNVQTVLNTICFVGRGTPSDPWRIPAPDEDESDTTKPLL